MGQEVRLESWLADVLFAAVIFGWPKLDLERVQSGGLQQSQQTKAISRGSALSLVSLRSDSSRLLLAHNSRHWSHWSHWSRPNRRRRPDAATNRCQQRAGGRLSWGFKFACCMFAHSNLSFCFSVSRIRHTAGLRLRRWNGRTGCGCGSGCGSEALFSGLRQP